MTAFNSGTSPKMIVDHYRNFIDDPQLIAKFWAPTPENVLAVKPDVALPNQKKIDWPNKAALVCLVWEKPLIHVAAGLKVSDVALRKHCVKLGIELPPNDYWVRQNRMGGGVDWGQRSEGRGRGSGQGRNEDAFNRCLRPSLTNCFLRDDHGRRLPIFNCEGPRASALQTG